MKIYIVIDKKYDPVDNSYDIGDVNVTKDAAEAIRLFQKGFLSTIITKELKE